MARKNANARTTERKVRRIEVAVETAVRALLLGEHDDEAADLARAVFESALSFVRKANAEAEIRTRNSALDALVATISDPDPDPDA